MVSASQRKEKLGAIFGLSLLALAMAWRWVFPFFTNFEWPRWHTPEALIAVVPAPMPMPIESGDVVPTLSQSSIDSQHAVPTIPTELDADARKALAEMLQQAENAVRDRHWLAPANDNALDWYAKALSIDPNSSEAQLGQEAVLESLFNQASAGLDEGDVAAANELILALNARDIADPRAHELAQRRGLVEQISPLLLEAAERMAKRQYVAPENANARASYRAVLALDPRNRAAGKGMQAIESYLLDSALTAASTEDFAGAEQHWKEASGLQTGSDALINARERIDDLKARHASGLMARAETALAARDIAGARALLDRAKPLGADTEYVATLEKLLDNANLYGRFQPGERFRDAYLDRSGEGPELVVIPVGHFRMGAGDQDPGRKSIELPQHDVEVSRPFAMASVETTVADFRRFIRATGYRTVAEEEGSSRYYEEQSGRIINRRGIDWENDYSGGHAKANDPVVHVAWRDAEAYAAWLTEQTGFRYRLPSEAEFEYALRAGSDSDYPWGDGQPSAGVGNLTGDGDRSRSKRVWDNAFKKYRDGHWGPSPVAQFAPNSLGLYDMVGNVSEWTADCMHENFLRAPASGEAWVNRGCGKRVVRGSSWGSAPTQSRSAFRASASEDTRSARIGFRVVREL